MVVLAVLGIVVIPTVKFMTSVLKGLVKVTPRAAETNIIREAFIVIERDINDMNEVVRGNNHDLQFYMDIHRHPDYLPQVDFDGDGIPNVRDHDLDNDALDFERTADFLRTVSTSPWKSGFNLEDDDDNNNGKRDVLCRYFYTPATGQLRRSFKFDGSAEWTNNTLILKNITAFDFAYFGSTDYIEGLPVGVIDQDNNRMITENEIAGMDKVPGSAGGALSEFNERRYIMGVRIDVTVQVNPKVPAKTNLKTEFWPPLLAVKRKYP